MTITQERPLIKSTEAPNVPQKSVQKPAKNPVPKKAKFGKTRLYTQLGLAGLALRLVV